MKFTDEQLRVIRHDRGHSLVSAVAGSGKTTTMVARVRHLLESGSAPNAILVLMFNRSASRHFAASLHRELAGTGLAPPQVRTFHALGLRLVESFIRRGAMPPRVLSTAEQRREALARQALTAAQAEGHGGTRGAIREDLEEFLGFIDLVKSTTDPAQSCFDSLGLPARFDYFVEAFDIFEALRRRAGLRFYDDLIHGPLTAMLADPELAAWVANRVDHVIVDEYQDINEVQQRLLHLLAGDRAQVMAVGDVDQCIYRWRGARPEYITNRFHHDFSQPSRYTLSFTFRYGHRLSLAANHLIGNNLQRDRKLCLSAPTNPDTRIERRAETCPHPILEVVDAWRKAGRRLGEAAVLVRLYALSIPLELALLEAGIPYRLEGHVPVFECREIKALTGYLRLRTKRFLDLDIHQRIDTLRVMLSQPHLGLPTEAIDRLATAIAHDPDRAPDLIRTRADADLPAFQRRKLQEAADNWRWLLRPAGDTRADQLLEEIVDRLDLDAFHRRFSARRVTAENRIATCRAFIEFAARQQTTAGGFLDRIEGLAEGTGKGEGDRLLITSIHRAKGLEWPLVIVPGLAEGVFPLPDGEDGELPLEGNPEDERRLFYVAMTRAIERMVLLHPADPRLETAEAAGIASPPADGSIASRFLYESNLAVSQRLGAMIAANASTGASPLAANSIAVGRTYLRALDLPVELIGPATTPATGTPSGQQREERRFLRMAEIGEGMAVFHRQFGNGFVTRVLDRSLGQLRVAFTEHGEKTLLAGPARLQPSRDTDETHDRS